MSEVVVSAPETAKPKEKILLETRPAVLMAILTWENLSLVGMAFVIGLASFVFKFGFQELLIIALLWAVLAFPSLRMIFSFGSTSYVLTNQRLVIFTVSIKNKEQSLPLNEIQGVKCKRSGLQNLYGAGDVLVQRKGLRAPLRLRALANCAKVAERIEKEAARARKGL